MTDLFSNEELVNVSSDTKDKIFKLIQELSRSKQTNTNDTDSSMIQKQYETERKRTAELQKKLDTVNNEKLKLETELKSQNENIYVMQVIFKQQYDELHELKQRLDQESAKRKTKIINILRKIDDANF